MAGLETQAAAQAAHCDLAAGKRKFIAWLAGSGATPGDHPALPGPARSGDRLGAAQLGYSPVLTRRLLGIRLRRLREASGILAADAAYQIRASSTKISRMELGRTTFKERDVADLLRLYGVTDPHEKDALLYLVRHANKGPDGAATPMSCPAGSRPMWRWKRQLP
jgi:Helix-turn-helix domain